LKFLQWLPRAGIQEALEAAQAGLETKLMVRLHKTSSDNYLELFLKTREHLVSGRLVLCSKVQTTGNFNELCSVRFAACVKKGMKQFLQLKRFLSFTLQHLQLICNRMRP
jgi:hypothetical protein